VSLLAVSLLQPVTDLDRSFQDVVQSARRPSLETVMRKLDRAREAGRRARHAARRGGVHGAARARDRARGALYALLPTNIVVERR
jgi:hypothetical protein